MPHYSEDELIEHLKKCKKKHGKVNTNILNNDDDFPSGPTFTYRFGSFSDALEQAGLSEDASRSRVFEGRRTRKYTEDEIKTKLRNISDSGIVTSNMINKSDNCPKSETICRGMNVDSIYDVDIDGIEIVKDSEQKVRDKDIIIDELKKADKNNDYLTWSVIESEDSCPTKREVKYYFNTLSNCANEIDVSTHSSYSRTNNLKNIFSAEHYVYTICVNMNGEDMYYVGETKNLIDRLGKHKNSDRWKFNYVVDIQSCKKENVDKLEREKSLEIAQRFDTTKIMGGR